MTDSLHNQADALAGRAAASVGGEEIETSLNLLRWRSALSRASNVPDLMGLGHLAQLCQDAGLAQSARMAYQIAFLHLGFSRESRARQTLFSSQAAMPDLRRLRSPTAGSGLGTVERAVGELQHLAHNHAAWLTTQPHTAAQGQSAVAPSRQDAVELIESLPAIVDDLFVFLEGDLPQDGLGRADETFARIRHWGLGLGDLDYRAFASAPLPLLAAATVAASLQEYLFLNDEFILGPLGSAALLHAVARFDDAGLGPYLSNLPRLARKSQDIFEFAQIAQAAGRTDEAVITREQWVVLLSTRLTGALRDEVVDDLGDVGAMAALVAIFVRAARQPNHRIDPLLIMRIRDAALDNADYELGANAQGLLARLFPDRLLERRLLGEIYATAGLLGVAEEVFVQCLVADPHDAATEERLAALRAGTFAEYRIPHGFGTPPERLRNRLLRRGRSALQQSGASSS